jgi:hypothetical protein
MSAINNLFDTPSVKKPCKKLLTSHIAYYQKLFIHHSSLP